MEEQKRVGSISLNKYQTWETLSPFSTMKNASI